MKTGSSTLCKQNYTPNLILAICPTARVGNDLQKESEGSWGKGEIKDLFDAAVDVMGFLLSFHFFLHNPALWLDLTLASRSLVCTRCFSVARS